MTDAPTSAPTSALTEPPTAPLVNDTIRTLLELPAIVLLAIYPKELKI